MNNPILRSLTLLLVATWASAPAQVRPVVEPYGLMDVEVAYVKFFTTDLKQLEARFGGKLGETLKGITCSDKEMFPRWKANQNAYRWVGSSPADVRRHVVREVKVAKLLESLFDQVKPDTDFEALAKEKGLSFHRYKGAGSRALMAHKDIGSPRALMMLRASGASKLRAGQFTLGTIVPYETRTKGVYWPRIFDEPGNFMALFRLMKVKPAK